MLKIHHIALKVLDLKKCEEFYTKVMALSVVARHSFEDGSPRSVWLDCDGVILMLEKTVGALPAKPVNVDVGWTVVALRIDVSERKSWTERLKGAGIEIFKTTEHSIYIKDPEENILALSHYPQI
jgi:catechol 2,3-dioxygenase-like lactoylglutathione lyase family enzyme